jgi:hypothetical protein
MPFAPPGSIALGRSQSFRGKAKPIPEKPKALVPVA